MIIRIHLIASSPLVRAGLEAMLRDDPRFIVIGTDSGAIPGSHPDVVLIESMAGEGLPRHAALRQDGLNQNALHQDDALPTVLLCNPMGRAQLRRALHSGVRAILPRDATASEIVAAIEGAVAGLVVLSSEDMDSLLPADAESADAGVMPGESLSSRELEVLATLAEGLVNKDIAARLKISEHTVKFHVRSIMGKLGATTRGEAVARGVREGLVVI